MPEIQYLYNKHTQYLLRSHSHEEQKLYFDDPVEHNILQLGMEHSKTLHHHQNIQFPSVTTREPVSEAMREPLNGTEG